MSESTQEATQEEMISAFVKTLEEAEGKAYPSLSAMLEDNPDCIFHEEEELEDDFYEEEHEEEFLEMLGMYGDDIVDEVEDLSIDTNPSNPYNLYKLYKEQL